MLVYCVACEARFMPGYSWCPECGSDEVMVSLHTLEGSEVGLARSGGGQAKLIGRDPEAQKTSPFLKHYLKHGWSTKRQQWEWVERIFNRYEDLYLERY